MLHLRFRLWMAMVTVAIAAVVMAEVGRRRERLARFCIASHERADACFDRTGRICKLGETPASVAAFYRRQGPTIWADYQAGLRHLALADVYDKAANRPWFPMLTGLPPSDGFADIPAIAEWGREALLEAISQCGAFVLTLIVLAGALRRVRSMHPGSRLINPRTQGAK